MKIANHRLVNDDGSALRYIPSPNHGGLLQAEYLVIHFTAGSSAESSIRQLCDNSTANKASAHLVIGRDGAVTQLVPFNRVAWHAGVSRWEGRVGMNKYSLGIELDNAGRLTRVGNEWKSWFKRTYPDNEVLEANHKHDAPGTPPCGWHTYTEPQMAAVLEVAELLMRKYGLRDVLGHDDIAPERKTDPGPDFPMSSVRARLLGRAEDDAEIFLTSTVLNIRQGPGTAYATLAASPLPERTQVEVLQRQGLWWQVQVLDVVQGDMDIEGWVHSRYLQRKT